MSPILSIFITIISLMPAIIFVIIFKVLLTILNRGKKKINEDFHEDERNLKNFHKERKSDTDTLVNEIKRIIKEEREKEKNKNISKSGKKKKRENILIDKDPKLSQEKLKEKLIEKRKTKEKVQENLSDSYNLEKSYNLSDTYNLEKTYNLSDTYNLEKDSYEKEKLYDKTIDSEFIRECESNEVFYEDEYENQNISLDFLEFDEKDLPKIIAYKEIFDKPLSLR